MEIREKQIILENEIIRVLREIYDPEIPVNIYDLGLIYDITIDGAFKAYVLMTLTTPNCPVAESLPNEVKTRILELEDITDADVEITFEPPWTMDQLSDEARLELGLF